ncbi:LOW QUALITY PROTEIN: pentatricopeptide repeat-containing protein At5g43790-like [Hibiscus syriacus]|uniref:LOW QUALITY PROTEIN: pentatricopeptide repeat-containing protein At5g43790-like n=1 Tax=Hibiscus syriacus TaxID=106335 RepID=UPI00192438CC|nr:LOW QUALITY PROTEIN: pentatricopeptide repeat-containing protein At5g43790-like [Hibiscus syriacus]
MNSSNSIFNHITLNYLTKCQTLNSLKQVHAQMITTGLTLHTVPLSKLLQSSATIALSHALTVFNQIPNPTIFLYNTLISSIVSSADPECETHHAFSLYESVLWSKNIKPNSHTYPSLFKACGYHPWLHHGLALHAHVLKFVGPTYDDFVQTSLLNFYANYGKLGVARCLFDQIRNPDLVTWNSMLSAYARCNSFSSYYYVGDVNYEDTSLSMEALCLFNEMQNSLVKPNEVTVVALVSACANLGALSQGIWAHVYAVKFNIKFNCYVGTALINMYSKCGCLDLAYQLFDKLPERDISCYNAMIGGFATHGYSHKALQIFEQMKSQRLVPDDVTFIVAMCACSHVGLVDEGCEIFESINKDYDKEPKLEHYGCLIDLLGRAGRVQEAKEKLKGMPMKPNAILWRSLLGAARVHGNLQVGEVALNHLVELEPETSGNYVLLSNMYASIDRWEDVTRVRKLMKDHGINKMPGSSLVEVDGAMHEFRVGDTTHPWTKRIYLKLEEIGRELQQHGHNPRTKEVLFDIDEEEKEDALAYHSERLAIAFALIASDSTAPIRIVKNLRVCSDCHESSKLISVIYGRDIIVRDRIRFHHFKNGTCSCRDYW